jgi:hypothetical protein
MTSRCERLRELQIKKESVYTAFFLSGSLSLSLQDLLPFSYTISMPWSLGLKPMDSDRRKKCTRQFLSRERNVCRVDPNVM